MFKSITKKPKSICKSPLSRNTSNIVSFIEYNNIKLKNKKNRIFHKLNVNNVFKISINKSKKFRQNDNTTLHKYLLQKMHLLETHEKVKKIKEKEKIKKQ